MSDTGGALRDIPGGRHHANAQIGHLQIEDGDKVYWIVAPEFSVIPGSAANQIGVTSRKGPYADMAPFLELEVTPLRPSG